MESVSLLVVDAITFGRTVVGLLTRPYETYRRITKHGRLGEVLFITILAAAYFALASLIKVAAFRPFLLTEQFLLLIVGAASGVLLSVGSLCVAGLLLGGSPAWNKLMIAWVYTLIPTTVWFLSTSMLYVVLPPPRTTSTAGIAFSLLFLVFSSALLWWKITLAYLTLRFALKLDLVRNIVVALACAPILAGWSIGMYKLGIFKVPFL